MANEVMCPYCGAMISEKATVCRHCGRILTGSVKYDADGTGVWYGDAPDGHTGEEAARMRRKSRGVLWLIIALCTLLVIGFIGLFAYFAFDFVSSISDSQVEDVDTIINEITGTDPTEGADDINTLPDLPGGVLSDQISLLDKYVEALQKNDREAAAKLFHPAILEAYDNDAEAMLYDLDQHLSLYGGKIKGWSTVDSGAVDQDDLNDLNESLPVGIENAEVHLIELQPEQGDAIEIFLLMVQTAEGWSLYYSY